MRFRVLLIWFSLLMAGLASCSSPTAITEIVPYQTSPVAPHVGSSYTYQYTGHAMGVGDSDLSLIEHVKVLSSGSFGNGRDSAFTLGRVSDTSREFCTSCIESFSVLPNGDLKFLSSSCNPYRLPFASGERDTILPSVVPVRAKDTSGNVRKYRMTMCGNTHFDGMELVFVDSVVYNCSKVTRTLNFTFEPMDGAAANSATTNSAASGATTSAKTLHYQTLHTFYYSPALGFFVLETEDGFGQWPGTAEPFNHYVRKLKNFTLK